MTVDGALAGELASIEAEINKESSKVGASVWRLGPGGTLLASIEAHAGDLQRANETHYFYADLEGSSSSSTMRGTMQKV